MNLHVSADHVVDFLETQKYYWFLDDYRRLIQVSKIDDTETRYLIRGQGPGELNLPLRLVATPEGPVLSGVSHLLRIEEAPRASLTKVALPVRGPLVYADAKQRLFGGAVNYWQADGGGRGAVRVQEGVAPQAVLPFNNPIGSRHPRCFAGLAQTGDTLLYGAPVDLSVTLVTGETGLPLSFDDPCIRKWQGQLPEHFHNPNHFVRAWDYFLANGTWLVQRQGITYAVVTLSSPCHDAVSFLWVVQSGEVQQRRRIPWDHARPLAIRLEGRRLRFVVATPATDGTHISLH